ncbi:bifunctional RNase H/acid phosphatase [Demequina pelophila]|uniref:bifunctional RNase H/acid phosphatase n=1 Tax=Demequina pelophila TaxID=1638984 RepID=UPI0007821AC7|nr:bifunctional RNase H/acid phosphatase [Demequina pelophila]
MTRTLIIEADGGSRGNPGPAGFGAAVKDGATGAVLAERAGYVGHATNNVAEYRGLIAGLEAARAIDPDARLDVRMDSKLVVEQMSGRWKVKHPDMKPLAARAQQLVAGAQVEYAWIPRERNKLADRLANEAMDTREEDIRRDRLPGDDAAAGGGSRLAGGETPAGAAGGAGDDEAPVRHDPTGASRVRAALAAARGEGVTPASDTQVEPRVEREDHPLPEGTDVDDAPDGATDPAGASSLVHPKVQSPFSPNEEDLVAPLTVVLVRHGVTEMTTAKRMSGGGVPGPSLSAAGRVQAAKVADALYRMGRRTWEHLPHVTRLLASPIVRTQETAGAIGRRLGAHVETDERLREIVFGEWEGLTVAEIAERDGDAIHRWRANQIAAPGGERIQDVGQRGWSLVGDVAADHARHCVDGRDVPRGVALVAHAVVIKSIVGMALDMDPAGWGAIWPSPASTTVLQVRAREDGSIAETHLLALGIPVE